MSKSILLLLLISIQIYFCSCEKHVLIDVEKAEPRLVMRANLTNVPDTVIGAPGVVLPVTLPNKLTMGMSSSVSGKPLDDLADCKVLIKKNNILLDTVFYDYNKEYYNLFENEADFPVAGDELEIDVICGDLSVSSKSRMPSKVPIKSIDTSSVYSIFIIDGRLYGSSSLTFEDPQNEENYYELIVSYPGLNNGELEMRKIRSDESFIKGESHYSSDFNTVNTSSVSESLLFSDKTFNGEEKTVNFYFEMGVYMNESTVEFQHTLIHYHLRNVSKEYYTFSTSKRNHLITNNVNFLFGASEPINVSSNVDNGLGLFGLYNHDQKGFFFPARSINL